MVFQLSSIFSILWPNHASAHVKWFIESTSAIEPFRISETPVLVWIGITLGVTIAACIVDMVLAGRSFVSAQSPINKRAAHTIFRLCIAAWLLFSAWQHVLLAPPFVVEGTLGTILLVMEAAMGVILVLGRLLPVVSALLIVLYVVVCIQFGAIEALDHLEVIGIAFFLFAFSAPRQFNKQMLELWAIPILRVLLGITLVVLAFSEKLLHPELAAQFLSTHPWNFMQLIGISWFSDRLFILSAGFTEMVFGLVFILGVVTRINTIMLAVFFLSTTFLLGLTEIVGHLPVFGMVALFLVYGAGAKLTLHNFLKR